MMAKVPPWVGKSCFICIGSISKNSQFVMLVFSFFAKMCTIKLLLPAKEMKGSNKLYWDVENVCLT